MQFQYWLFGSLRYVDRRLPHHLHCDIWSPSRTPTVFTIPTTSLKYYHRFGHFPLTPTITVYKNVFFPYIAIVLHSWLQKRVSISCLFLAVCNVKHYILVATQNKATTKRFKRGKFRILIFAPVLWRITLETTKISLKIVLSAKVFSMDPALDSGVSHISFNLFALIPSLFLFFFLKPENYCVNEDIVYTCQ